MEQLIVLITGYKVTDFCSEPNQRNVFKNEKVYNRLVINFLFFT